MQAKDGVGNIGMKAVKVTVTNVEEGGTVTLSQLQPRVGVAITASVTDLDGDVSNVTWQWSRDAPRRWHFTAIEKATSATYKPVKPVGGDAGATSVCSCGRRRCTPTETVRRPRWGHRPMRWRWTPGTVPPVFDDQDEDTDGVQNEVTTRKVAENTAIAAA